MKHHITEAQLLNSMRQTANTTKNYNIKEAPRRIQLFGDKTRKIESSQHIIEFPGGAIEVSRCDNGEYWAHLIVNCDFAMDDIEGREHAIGEVVDARIDDNERGVLPVPNFSSVRQVALRIKPLPNGPRGYRYGKDAR